MTDKTLYAKAFVNDSGSLQVETDVNNEITVSLNRKNSLSQWCHIIAIEYTDDVKERLLRYHINKGL